MALDGYSFQEHPPLAPPPLRMVEQPRLDTPEQRLAAANAQLAEARRSRDNFYDVALNGSRLNEDQKILLGQLKEDDRLTRLTEVVHTDEKGETYTFMDYFAPVVGMHDGAEDVLNAARSVITELREATDVQTAAIKAVEMAKHAPADRRPGTVRPLGETAAAFEGRFHRTWVAQSAESRAHLDGIYTQYMSKEKIMPFSERGVFQEVAPADPFVQSPAETAAAPVVEAQNPSAYAPPDAQTVVMPMFEAPAAPKPKSWFERLAA